MTNAEFTVLTLVIEQPRHGYEIEQVIEQRHMRDWTEIGFSSIYHLLGKLQREELVESHLDKHSQRGPARRVYSPTEKGREIWKAEALQVLSTPRFRNNSLLTGLVTLQNLSLEDAANSLRVYADTLREQIATVDAMRENYDSDRLQVRAVFSYITDTLKSELKWIENFIPVLEGGK